MLSSEKQYPPMCVRTDDVGQDVAVKCILAVYHYSLLGKPQANSAWQISQIQNTRNPMSIKGC